jgi:hypothetical protein
MMVDKAGKEPGAPRVSREYGTREADTRAQDWAPASGLPDPDPEPGYEHRWIRISTNNEADASNASSKLREGWEPVTIEQQPKYRYSVELDRRFSNPNKNEEGNVEIGGLLLCKIPTHMFEQRTKHFSAMTQRQMEAVGSTFMRENDERMPLFSERSNSTSFGKGK